VAEAVEAVGHHLKKPGGGGGAGRGVLQGLNGRGDDAPRLLAQGGGGGVLEPPLSGEAVEQRPGDRGGPRPSPIHAGGEGAPTPAGWAGCSANRQSGRLNKECRRRAKTYPGIVPNPTGRRGRQGGAGGTG